jgi:hypothetical protein
MQCGHYLIKMEKTKARKMWNSSYSVMYFFGSMCSDSEHFSADELLCFIQTETCQLRPSCRTVQTDTSSVSLPEATTPSPCSQQTWEHLLSVDCLTWFKLDIDLHGQAITWKHIKSTWNQEVSKPVMVHVNTGLL